MKNMHKSAVSNMDVAQLQRLHYFLSYNRYTIFTYGGFFFIPFVPLYMLLVVLAIAFGPYVIFVLYRNGKRGWLLAFGLVVGIPTVLAFIPVHDIVAQTALHFLPLLTFYSYCFLLRLTMSDWISDLSAAEGLWNRERETQNRIP